MISVEEWTTIRCLKGRGVSNRAIASQLGISRNTVETCPGEGRSIALPVQTQNQPQLEPLEE